MVIQHNISALNSHRQLGLNNSATSKNLEKLASGYKINRAGDDAAGLAISEKMRGQIRGLAMAEQNANNGISLIQTAEGGLNETHAILQRMRELAVQSANGTYKDEVDRENLDKEVQALKSEITRIAESTHYNGIKLLDGSMGTGTMEAADWKIGTAAGDNSIISKITGESLSTEGSFAAKLTDGTFGNTGTTHLQITFTDTNGNAKVYQLRLEDDATSGEKGIISKDGFGNKGTTATVDLTSVGLGRLEVIATDSSATVTGDALVTAINNLAVAPKAGTTTGKQGELIFQIGANGGDDQRVSLSVGNMSAQGIGVDRVTIATQQDANDAIAVIDNAINIVSGTRADLGALQNRLEHTLNNLGVTKENLTAAESTIRDVDMAKEMMEFTKNSILVQASQAMLAQANQLPQGVLSLLR